MRRSRSTYRKWLPAVWLLVVFTACARELPEDWRAWIAGHHHRLSSLTDTDNFSDLAFLDELLSGRRILQLGENDHGIAEFNQIKVRLIRYLHEQLGFNVLAFEANFFTCLQIDNRLADLSAETAMSACIPRVWRTDELLGLFSYVKGTRDSHTPMHVVGFDVIPALSLRAQAEYFRGLVQPIDPSYADEVARFDSVTVDRLLAEDFDYVLENEDRMVKAYRALATFFDQGIDDLSRSPTQAREWALAAQAARSMVAFVQQGAADIRDHDSPLASFLRDSAMAENVLFLTDEIFPEERFVLWAHNVHVRNGGEQVAPFYNKSMGQWLVEWRRNDVFTIGLFMASGTALRNDGRVYDIDVPKTGDLESILQSVGYPWHVVDLNGTPRHAGTEWVFTPRVGRRDGTREERFVPAEQYDALLFIDEVNPARRR